MSSKSSTNGRLRGIYLRGKRFWFRHSYQGHHYRVPLDTHDEATAITKALKIRANPVLTGANPLKEEAKDYIESKREKRRYTRDSADSRLPVLNAWIRDRKLKEVREIKDDNIKSWLTSLRRRKPPLEKSNIESYGMIIRGFCSWLVEEGKLRENPAGFVKVTWAGMERCSGNNASCVKAR